MRKKRASVAALTDLGRVRLEAWTAATAAAAVDVEPGR